MKSKKLTKNLKNIKIILPLLVILFMISLKIFLVINSNLGFNEAIYKYMAEEINKGNLPYKDVFDHKPPVVYYTLALFFRIFGSSLFTLHTLALLFDCSLLVAIFFIAKKLYNTEAALYASALFSVFINFVFYDTEIPMTLFGLLGIYLYLTSYEKNKKHFILFLSGIFLALSVWSKQPGILFFFAILIHQANLVYKKKIELKSALKSIYLITAGALVLSIPLLSYFIYAIGFKTFYFHIITFSLIFQGSTSRILQVGKFFYIFLFYFGVLFAIILAFFKDIAKKNQLFVIVSSLILIFFIANQEIFYTHFIQLMPFIIFLAVFPLSSKIDGKYKKFIAILLIIAMFNFIFLTLNTVARNIRDESYLQQAIVVDYIKENIPEDANLFSDTPIFYSLTGFRTEYKPTYLAPSTSSVFNLSNFCSFSLTQDYLLLTHRKKYLGEENLLCIKDNFILQTKFENVDESYVEIWKKK